MVYGCATYSKPIEGESIQFNVPADILLPIEGEIVIAMRPEDRSKVLTSYGVGWNA